MSYNPRGPGRPPAQDGYSKDNSGPGSVRAARERLLQAQTRLREQTKSPETRNVEQPASQFSSIPIRSPKRVQPQPQTLGQFYPPQPSPQSPQWPLARGFGLPASPSPRSLGGGIPPPPRNPARQMQSPRSANNLTSTYSPSSVERSQIPVMTKPSKPEPARASPSMVQSRPVTTSSQTTDSSLGSIPDFPVPSNIPMPRQTPSSNAFALRRGPSSFYSQNSNVTPIKEEDTRASMKSYASSNVIPANTTDFYYDTSPSDDEPSSARNSDQIPRSSPLVRQASIGKRLGKPTLTSIKSQTKTPSPPETRGLAGVEKPIILPSEGSLIKNEPTVAGAFVVPTKSGNNASQPQRQASVPESRSSESQSYANELEEYLGDLEKDTDEPTPNLRQVPKSMLGERVGLKRPKDLDFEKLRAQEARGSLTSLPELIKRATRLAANLDRGKTASRLGMDWMIKEEGQTPNMEEKQDLEAPVRLHSPAHSTPRTEWPSNRSGNPILRDSEEARSTPKGKLQRRCCGMSRNAFLGLMFLLIMLITAAIIMPVALIVIPSKINTTPAQATACAKKVTCSNGGNSVTLSNGSCGCICVNGFQGSTCSKATDAGCTTINVPGVNKATAGTEVAQLLQMANNFSIPLDSRALVEQFAEANMTCASQNALVKLPAIRKSVAQVGTRIIRRQPPPRTTNGIIVAGAPTTALAELTSTITVIPTASSAAIIPVVPTVSSAGVPPAIPTNIPVANETAQDFAQVGILFVLQDSEAWKTAATAQEKLDAYMTTTINQGASPATAANVSLGNGYYINMWDWKVTLKNGTVYGDGWNGTATALPDRPSGGFIMKEMTSQ